MPLKYSWIYISLNAREDETVLSVGDITEWGLPELNLAVALLLRVQCRTLRRTSNSYASSLSVNSSTIVSLVYRITSSSSVLSTSASSNPDE